MMYGEELHVINGAIGDAQLATAINLNAAANTVALLKTMELPGNVLYWGFRVTTAFAASTTVTPGLLTLYRYTKVIQTAVLGNAGGTGYAVGDLLTVTQAGGSGAILRVLTAPLGVVATVEIVNAGVNYTAAANLPTVKLNGAGDDAFTVTISDKKAIDTIVMADEDTPLTAWAVPVGYLRMARVPVTIGDTSPTPAPPNSYKAGEGLAIEVTTMLNGDVAETGAYQPIIIIQNRGENFAAQPLWVTAV
jgi:hypothetical protein